MGMALLANLAAHDFGYISTGELLRRTERALRTMEKLERFRGHFYNWYDTAHAASRSTRSTSLRSTAAISPAAC